MQTLEHAEGYWCRPSDPIDLLSTESGSSAIVILCGSHPVKAPPKLRRVENVHRYLMISKCELEATHPC